MIYEPFTNKTAGPAGPKTVPRCGFRRRTRLWRTSTDMKSEMSVYLRLPGSGGLPGSGLGLRQDERPDERAVYVYLLANIWVF